MATAETARRNPGGRPAIGPQITIAFPPDMLARVDAAAGAAGVSRAEWIRRAAVAALTPTSRRTPHGHRGDVEPEPS